MVSKKLTPIGDRIVIKPEPEESKTKSGIVLPDAAKEKPSEGTVVAVGSGRILDNGQKVLPEVIKKKEQVEVMVQDGKFFWEVGRLEEAEAKLKEAARLDPENKAAFYYLRLVNESKFAQESRKREFDATASLVETLNLQVRQGSLKNRGGERVLETMNGGLIRSDKKYLYPVREDIPILLIEEAIPLS